MKYSSISLNGARVPHSTVRGLKLAMRQGKLKPGNYTCQCPGGNVHVWEIVQSGVHVSVGYAPRKKSARIGKGINVYNYAAKLIEVRN